jgi:N-acetylglucosaminyldiphosphoundecaprenol N-acetyl-beta-D-mannosaminyltransferase
MVSLERISILGVSVHNLTMAQAVAASHEFIESGQPHIIVTADASGVVLAQNDEEFRNIVNNADLVTPDSAGMLWASRKFGTPLTERVSGVDLAQEICALAAKNGYKLFLLGAAPGVAETAAENLKKKHPGLNIVGIHDGYFTEDAPIVKQVKESGAQILFVATGIPKQEKWIIKHREELGVSLAIGLGGSFDVFSGNVRRAPQWMRKHGLEWVYRLASNPKKISKVATLPKFVMMVLRDKMFHSSGK